MLKNLSMKFLLLGVFVLVLCGFSFAQEEKPNATTEPHTQYKSVVLDGDQKLELDFTINTLGSVTVQVLQKTAQDGAEPKGVAGFRVRLRSKDRGFERWYLDQFTDDSGTYTFECLRPGNYMIELDPEDLKAADTAKPR